MQNYGLAFLLTILAGLSTCIGSLIALTVKKTNKKFLSMSLGFSAGVMIYVSMVEIFFEAKERLVDCLGETKGYWITVIGFFLGMALIAVIDKLIPYTIEDNANYKGTKKYSNKKLTRVGVFTAVAVAIHNFPEGLATFVSSLHDIEIAIPIVVAIAIHNIPEGIAVSMPIYYATGSKKKAFMYSFLSGITEPLGAILGLVILMRVMNDLVFGLIFAVVAGIMVFISFDELLPTSMEYGDTHTSVYSLIVGMMVMALSLLLFA